MTTIDTDEINLDPLLEALKAEGEGPGSVLVKIVQQLKEAREVIESMYAACQLVDGWESCRRIYERWKADSHK